MNEESTEPKTIEVNTRAILMVNSSMARQKLNRITKDLLYKEYMIEILDMMLAVWTSDILTCDMRICTESPLERLHFFRQGVESFVKRISISTFIIHNQTNRYLDYSKHVSIDHWVIDSSHFYIGLKMKNANSGVDQTIWLFEITMNPRSVLGTRFVVKDLDI